MLPLQARQKSANRQHWHKHQGCAEIGLLQDQDQRNPHNQSCLDKVPQIKLIRAHLSKEARQHNDYNQFDQFRHLEEFPDTREVDPALGAEAGVAHRQHGDEGRDAEQVENRGLIQNQMVVEPGEREHQEEADGEPAHLLPVHAR